MQLHFHVVDLKLAHSWKIARTAGSSNSKVMVVKLADSSGITGLGEAAPIARYQESVETVAAFLQKVNPRTISSKHLAKTGISPGPLSQGEKAAKCPLNTVLRDGAPQL